MSVNTHHLIVSAVVLAMSLWGCTVSHSSSSGSGTESATRQSGEASGDQAPEALDESGQTVAGPPAEQPTEEAADVDAQTDAEQEAPAEGTSREAPHQLSAGNSVDGTIAEGLSAFFRFGMQGGMRLTLDGQAHCAAVEEEAEAEAEAGEEGEAGEEAEGEAQAAAPAPAGPCAAQYELVVTDPVGGVVFTKSGRAGRAPRGRPLRANFRAEETGTFFLQIRCVDGCDGQTVHYQIDPDITGRAHPNAHAQIGTVDAATIEEGTEEEPSEFALGSVLEASIGEEDPAYFVTELEPRQTLAYMAYAQCTDSDDDGSCQARWKIRFLTSRGQPLHTRSEAAAMAPDWRREGPREVSSRAGGRHVVELSCIRCPEGDISVRLFTVPRE